MENEITKQYYKGEFIVEWRPKKCIHAAICVKTLPNVYRPDEKPWIKLENATTEELIAQIKKCPSGALSYQKKEEKDVEDSSKKVIVEVKKNGPLLVHGQLNVIDKNGDSIQKDKITAFCRCGASSNKPYCDGAHTKINFTD